MQDHSAAEAAIAKALTRTVPGYDLLVPPSRDQVDWAAAPLYVRRHLVDHAAAAGAVGYELIDRLLQDDQFLTNVSLPNLRATVATLSEPRLQAVADAVAAARLSAADARVSWEEEPGLLLAQLSAAARVRGLDQVADSIPMGHAPSAPWKALWAAWRSEPTTWQLVSSSSREHLMVTAPPDPSSPTVVSVCADHKLHAFDVVSARELVPAVRIPSASGGRIEHLVSGLLPGHGPVVATIREGGCQVWSANSLEPLGPHISVGRIAGAAFVTVVRGVRLLTVQSSGLFQLWDVATGQTDGGSDREVSDSTVSSVCALAPWQGGPAGILLGFEGDGGVHQLELERQSPAVELAGHGNRTVRGLGAIDIRNERILVAGGEDGQIRIWRGTGASPLMIQPDRSAAPSAVQAVTCTSVGGVPVTLAVTHDVARMYDLDTGKEIASWITRRGGITRRAGITSVATVTVDDRSLAVFTVTGGGAPVVWDLSAAGSAYEPFTGHTQGIETLVLGRIAGRRRLVTSGRDATLRVWDPDGGGQVGGALQVAREGARRPMGCAWAVALAESDGVSYIVSGEDDGSIRSWNGADGRLLATVPSLGSSVMAMLSTRMGGRPAIVAGTKAGRLVAVRPGATQVEADWPAGDGRHSVRALTEVELGPDRTRSVVAAGDNEHLYIWVPGESGGIRTREHAQHVAALETLGPGVVLTGGDDGRVLRVNLDDETDPPRELVPAGGAVTAMTLAKEDRRLVLVTAHDDKQLRFTDLSGTSGRPALRVRPPGGVVRALDTDTADPRATVFAAGDDQSVSQWDLRGRRTTLHRDRVWAVTTCELPRRSGSEPVAISGSGDDVLQIRALRTGAVRRVISARQGGVRSVACARTDSGPVLLSGGVDGSVEIHDLDGLRHQRGGRQRDRRRRLAEQRGWVRAIGVGATPGGTPIAVAGAGDGTIMCWGLNDDRPQPGVRRIHDQEVRAVAVSALDSRPVVVSGGMDGRVVVSDFETLSARSQSWEHNGGVRALVALRLDDRPVVVSGGAEGDVLCRRLDDEVDLGEIPHGPGEVNGLATHEVELGQHKVWLAVATGRTITLSSYDGSSWHKRTSVLVDRDVLSLSLQGTPQCAGPENLAVAGTLGVMVVEFLDWK